MRNLVYRQTHAEEILEHRLANKDEMAAYGRKYYQAHRAEKWRTPRHIAKPTERKF